MNLFIKRYDRITRKEAAELCRPTSPQARDLLARMAKQGTIKRIGEKRGSYYTLSAP